MVKYRKQLLIGDLGQFIKASIFEISAVFDFSVEEIEIAKDHVNILMRISPKYSVSQHVRNIKQMIDVHLSHQLKLLRGLTCCYQAVE